MTPEEIRAKALECAIRWVDDTCSTPDMLSMAATFEGYIKEATPAPAVKPVWVKPPSTNRLAPLPSIVTPGDTVAEGPREHLDHDGDLWGPLCARCAHSREIHKSGGCHFPEVNAFGAMTHCECEGYTDVRPASRTLVQAVECARCEQPWSDTHGQPGDPCPADVTPEPSQAGCTCHKHTHRYGQFTSPDRCLQSGCYCRWAGGRTA